MKFLSKIVAAILFTLLIPFLLIVSLISLLSQGRPIIFKQTRMGLNFKKFTIYKFRSMHKSSEGINSFSNGQVFSATKWGHFIRKMKIDELPQLYNIIRGDMAFIGPRPEIPEFVDFKSFRYLSYIKPGLSCYSTILFRDESQKFTFLDNFNVTFSKGWERSKKLQESFEDSLDKDKAIGYTSKGPHRMDITFQVNNKKAASNLSRGQLKILILLIFLINIKLIKKITHKETLLMIDDLGSELDVKNLRSLIEQIILS